MRIWNEKLIPKLCTKHLVAMWREGLGCAKIITHNKSGYRNHPATQEFINAPKELLIRLTLLYKESLKRGYRFSFNKLNELQEYCDRVSDIEYKEWQTLEEQIEVLRSKGCNCNV